MSRFKILGIAYNEDLSGQFILFDEESKKPQRAVFEMLSTADNYYTTKIEFENDNHPEIGWNVINCSQSQSRTEQFEEYLRNKFL